MDSSFSSDASDLAWMLRSSQVNDHDLIRALTQVYYTDLYRLSLACLMNPDQARTAAVHTLAAAAAARHTYWGDPPLRLWLFQLTLDACSKLASRGNATQLDETTRRLQRTFAKLPTRQRQGVVLFHVLELPLEEVSSLLKESKTSVASWLDEARLLMIQEKIFAEEDVDQLNQERLNYEIQALWPAPSLPSQEIGFINSVIKEELSLRQQRSHRALAYRQAILLIGFFMMVFIGWRLFDQFFPEPVEIPDSGLSKVLTTPRLDPEQSRRSTPLPKGVFLYRYVIRSGDTLEYIAEQAGISTGAILALNDPQSLSDFRPGDTITLSSPPLTAVESLSLKNDRLPKPLTLNSPPEEIIQRMKEGRNFYDTLSLTLQFYSYGSPNYTSSNYSGPPLEHGVIHLKHLNPDRSMIVVGIPSEGPVWLSYQIQNLNLESEYRRGSGALSEITGYFSEENESVIDYLHRMQEESVQDLGTMQVSGVERVAGRQTIIVEWLDGNNNPISRYWVDAVMGIILQSWGFQPIRKGGPLHEWVVTDIEFNVELPDEVFDPTSDSLVGILEADSPSPLDWFDATPTPALDWRDRPRTFQTPPPGFDPADFPLTLQWPTEDAGESPSTGASAADMDGKEMVDIAVFSGTYYLGDLEFPKTKANFIRYRSCSRSPDGRQVILELNYAYSSFSVSEVYWFQLGADMALQHIYSDEGSRKPVAFSPDSTIIAYWGCESGEGCGLFTLDIATNRSEKVISDLNVRPAGIAWSPDGQLLALAYSTWDVIPLENGWPKLRLVVYALESGEEVYSSSYSWDEMRQGSAPEDFPMAASSLQHWLEDTDQGCLSP